MTDTEEQPTTISVTGVTEGIVGLWEIDPAHPDGEILVKYESPVEAAETAGVLQALAEGRIKKADKADQQKAADAKAAEQKAADQQAQQQQQAAKQPEKK